MSTKTLFHSATLRLTAWYMAILIVLCLLFSTIVFGIASREFERAVGPPRPGEVSLFIQSSSLYELRQARINESRQRLIGNLILFNIITIAAGGITSYLLARRTLQPIEEALHAQSRFSSDAAHELRTPLTVMQSEIEVGLRDSKATKKSYEEVLESNLDEVHRLKVLTDRLLMLASSQPLPLSPTLLEEVAITAVNHSIPLAMTKKISIDNQIGHESVQANAESLCDVLTILIDNAIKYSPKKSTITLTSTQKDKTVLISVHDEGIGVSEDEQEKIFDRFYRADTSRSKQNVEGHGLGLSIAKQLVELQDGQLSVESELGKGSVFSIRLDHIQSDS